MAKKTQEVDADETTIADELNDIAIKAEVRKVGGGGKIIPTALANALKTKIDSDGAFAVPKQWLEEKIGLDVSKPMKGRPNAIKKKLNKQYADLAGDGYIWHVGNSGNTHYLISILEASSEEEDKWKKPKPKKEGED